MVIHNEVKELLEDNKEFLDDNPNEILNRALQSPDLYPHHVAQLLEIFHSVDIEIDYSFYPKYTGYMDYKFTFEDTDTIIDEFYKDTASLTITTHYDDLDNMHPINLYSDLAFDYFIKNKCVIKEHDWEKAKPPYIITIAPTITQENRIFTTASITSGSNLNSYIQIFYPKICGRVLENVGYMYSKNVFKRQADSFKDQLERVFKL